MKRRAQVFTVHVLGVTSWHLDVWNSSGVHTICAERGSWADAFADALAEVGLARPRIHLDDAGLRALAALDPTPGTNPEPMEAP